jgi:hypothetical protein
LAGATPSVTYLVLGGGGAGGLQTTGLGGSGFVSIRVAV